ncbi:MAG: long-chain fatty acid--CoA ligase [Zetaproteobacteria bacterium]|nr:MAG: long-chain fatty acid--CoA ligase [Zetaproteobacteria bacterium]
MRSPTDWQKPAGECIGRQRALRANSLVELLLSAPPEWLDRPLLFDRRGERDWRAWRWVHVQEAVLRLAAWLEAQGVKPGDRVGLLGHNRPEWLIADFAILRLGAVTVPAYYTDPPEAVRYVFEDADVHWVLVEEGEQAEKLQGADLKTLVFRGPGGAVDQVIDDPSWDRALTAPLPTREMLATIIYTSGTTGRPKGVMLTHGNILSDIAAGLGGVPVHPGDRFLSFLPLAHAFERTVGHFLPVASGAEIAYAEAVTTVMRDAAEVDPTVILSVPRLFERVYATVLERVQSMPAYRRALFAEAQRLGWKRFQAEHAGGVPLSWWEERLWRLLDRLVHAPIRARFGSRLRAFVCGGAALHPNVARFFLAAGMTLLPGYGLSEASPVLTVNRERWIKPDTVGPPLPGVELKIAEDGELLARGPMVMQGYWRREEETKAALADGWLHTGDIAEIDEDGFVRIVDRKKEIMVLSTGENVPPAAIETRLVQDPTIQQAMVIADGRPYVAALLVPDEEALARAWQREKKQPLPENWRENEAVRAWIAARMRAALHDLPRYMQVRRFALVDRPWTLEAGELTPTLKLKRRKILRRYEMLIASLFPEDETLTKGVD